MKTNNSNIEELDEFDDWGPLSSLPGNPIMWIFVLGEIAVFGAILIVFIVLAFLQPDAYLQFQSHMNRVTSSINTAILLASGFFAALALRSQLASKPKSARNWLFATIIFGLLFLAIKITEYKEKFAHGLSMDSSDFFMIYFLATGFHAAHVALGILIMFIVIWKNTTSNILTAITFWHMVDVIWVLLFAVIYWL